MKVLSFTIPVAHDKTIIVQEDIAPDFYPHLHRHQELQLTLVLKGTGTLLVGNSMHVFKPGTLFLIGANMPHVFKSDEMAVRSGEEDATHALTIFFNTKGKLASLFELPELKTVHHFFAQHSSGFQVPAPHLSEISGRMFSIKYASGLDQLMQFFQLLKGLSTLENIEPLTRDPEPKAISDHEGIRISAIYNYIMQHYHRDLTLEEVASAAYMTPQAFCRYFKKHTRLTFVSFLNEVRINEACKKLINGSYNSVSSVAYECGFNSITNFNRVFKTTIGKSPREYMNDFLSRLNQ